MGGAIKDHLILASVSALVIAPLINSFSVKATGSVATFFTDVKVLSVCAVGVCAFLFSSSNWLNYALSGAAGAWFAGIAAAMAAALWGYTQPLQSIAGLAIIAA